MSIEVRLFGELKRKAERLDDSGYVGKIEIGADDASTVEDILSFLDLEESDVSHMFVNFKYSDLDTAVREGDRVSIFPRDMALLYRWYFKGGLERSYKIGKTRRGRSEPYL